MIKPINWKVKLTEVIGAALVKVKVPIYEGPALDVVGGAAEQFMENMLRENIVEEDALASEYDRGLSDAKFDIANQLRKRMTAALTQAGSPSLHPVTDAVYGYIEELEGTK